MPRRQDGGAHAFAIPESRLFAKSADAVLPATPESILHENALIKRGAAFTVAPVFSEIVPRGSVRRWQAWVMQML